MRMSPIDATSAMVRLYYSRTVFTRRSLLVLVLVLIDVTIAVVYRLHPDHGQGDAFGRLTVMVLYGFVLPFSALQFGTAVVRDEADAGTLTYILNRPISRTSFLLGRLGAALIAVMTVVLATALLNKTIMATSSQTVGYWRVLAGLAIGAVAYTTVFTALGATVKRPFLFGLMFLLFFEFTVSKVPATARYITVRAHLENIAGFSGDVLGFDLSTGVSVGTSVTAMLVSSAIILAFSLLLFNRREFIAD